MPLHPSESPLRQNAEVEKEKDRYKTLLVATQHGVTLVSCSVLKCCQILHQLHDFLLTLINSLSLDMLCKLDALLVKATYYCLLLFDGQHFIR